jgi:RNA polymerase sigma-70 factor (ECF subfamily)
VGPAKPDQLSADTPAEPFDERALVVAARGDAAAFGILYRRYVERIYAFAYRRTWTREAAEDVTAATFERAMRHLERFDTDGAGFGPWLFRIAANELVDHYRREGRPRSERGQRGLHVLAEDAVEDDLEPIERDDEVRQMIEALDTLRPRYQRALTLRYLAGLSADDAAHAMGCSKPVLAVTLHRALGALRRAVECGDEPDQT